MDKISGIYKITNLINSKIYIGSSKDILKRLNYHKKAPRKMIIHKAIKKYGVDNFIFEIIEHCPVEMLIQREQYYYDVYNPEYNAIRPIENPMENEDIKKKHKIIQNSERYKQTISAASKKQWANKTKEEREYIVKTSHSKKANEKRIKTMTSQEYRNKVSGTMKKIWSDEDYRKKHIPQKIKILNDVVKRKDVKEKLSKSSKKRWEDNIYREKIISQTIAPKRKIVYLNDGDKIHKFESISECGRWLSETKGVSERSGYSSAVSVLRGRTKSAYGFSISFDRDVKPFMKLKRIVKNPTTVHYKAVVMLDDNLNPLNKFESVKKAAGYININSENISRVCKGVNKTAGGYKWMYLEDYENEYLNII